MRFYNKVAEDQEKRQAKYQKHTITYKEGVKVLLKNRELPSTLEGITKKLLLLYTGPYVVVNDKHNNTYESVSYTHLDVYKRQSQPYTSKTS